MVWGETFADDRTESSVLLKQRKNGVGVKIWNNRYFGDEGLNLEQYNFRMAATSRIQKLTNVWIEKGYAYESHSWNRK